MFGKKVLLQDRIYLFFVYCYVTIALLLVLYPLIYIVSASLSNPHHVNSGEMWLFPKEITWMGYEAIFANAQIWTGYKNTLIYTLTGTAVNLAVTLPVAYALSRKDFFGRSILMNFFIIPMFISGGLIPTYILMRNLGFLDTIWAMIIPGAASMYNIVVTRTFFETTIPKELEEAAIIDGCNDFTMFIKIILPLSLPIIAVMGLFYGVGHWNSFFNALIYLSDKAKYPLQMVLREILVLQDLSSTNTGAMMNSSMAELAYSRQQLAEVIKYGVMIVSTLPIIVAYPFLQKYFVKGVMVGSIKG